MIRKILIHIYIILLSISAQAANREQFTNVYTFGDSFSGQGTWTEFLMQRYGINYVDRKNGFAVGGKSTKDLQVQLSNYYAAVNGYDANALYLVFMGPSDAANSYSGDLIERSTVFGSYQMERYNISDLANKLPDGSVDMTDLRNKIANGQINPTALVPTTIDDLDKRAILLKNFVITISNSGARYIVVFNNFKNALRWDASSDYLMCLDEIWVNLWNSSIYKRLNELPADVNIILIDINRLLNEVTSSPVKYFTNAEIAGTEMNQGFFAGGHPTTAAHRLFSQYVASVIESPSRVAMVREIPLLGGSRFFYEVENISSNFSNKTIDRRFDVEIKGDYSKKWTDALTRKELGFSDKSKGYDYRAIMNFKAGENGLMGLILSHSSDDMHFATNHGTAKINEVAVAGHAVYHPSDPLFTYFTVGFGKVNYSIRRNIVLGIGENSQYGKTTGNHYLSMVGVGYRKLLNDQLAIIPGVNLNYQQVSMKKYTENGPIQSTTMSFDIPNRKSLKAESTLSIESNFKVRDKLITSTLTASYAYDFINPMNKQIRAHVSDMPRWFSVPAYNISASSFGLYGSVRAGLKDNLDMAINSSIKPLSRMKEWSVGISVKASF